MYTFCIQGEAWTKKTFGLPRKLYSLWQWRQHLSWGLGAEAEMNESQMWICFALKSFFSIPRTKMGVNNPTPAWPRNLWFRDRSSIPCSEWLGRKWQSGHPDQSPVCTSNTCEETLMTPCCPNSHPGAGTSQSPRPRSSWPLNSFLSASRSCRAGSTKEL